MKIEFIVPQERWVEAEDILDVFEVGDVLIDDDGDVAMLCVDEESDGAFGLVFLHTVDGSAVQVGDWFDVATMEEHYDNKYRKLSARMVAE